MADQKTTKKADKFEGKSVDELRADLLTARQGLHTGTLQNPHHIKSVKKAIARKLTAENNNKEEKGTK